jgi:hypothetical protein
MAGFSGWSNRSMMRQMDSCRKRRCAVVRRGDDVVMAVGLRCDNSTLGEMTEA